MIDQKPTAYEEAILNIGAVTRVTGIPIATMHAWERRYGFPRSSARTPGGHRLYSQKDVTQLRCVKAQIERGVSARQAVTAVQNMESGGCLPLGQVFETSRSVNPSPASPAFHVQLTEALFRHDLARADQLIGEMLAIYSPEEITLNVIGPALAELGDAWAEGRIKVSDEHLASNYLRQRLLMWMVTGPRPRETSPIVLACAPDEWHEGSLLMLGVLLRRQGWPVAYLGQNVPFTDLATFVQQVQPGAVVLVGMCAEPARLLVDWPHWITQTAGRPLVTYGGRAFVVQPELQGLVPGTYLGDTIQEGVDSLEELLGKYKS